MERSVINALNKFAQNRHVVAVTDKNKKWCAIFVLFEVVFDDMLRGIVGPKAAFLYMVNLKGQYRESEHPFEVACEMLAEALGGIEIKPFSRDEAQADPMLALSEGFYDAIDECVGEFWEEREDEPCTPEVKPASEAIPNEVTNLILDEGELPCGIRIVRILIG
jgi:hypothetical protein